jgi:type I restriction enzyme M protein
VEAVILLPENHFYNTTAPGIIMLINKKKAHPGEVLLINASKLFSKGKPKNYLTQEHVEKVAEIYHQWREDEDVSAIVTKKEVARNDYNLSPSRYVAGAEEGEVLPLEEAVVLLQEAEEEREEADRELDEVLSKLGLEVRQIG